MQVQPRPEKKYKKIKSIQINSINRKKQIDEKRMLKSKTQSIKKYSRISKASMFDYQLECSVFTMRNLSSSARLASIVDRTCNTKLSSSRGGANKSNSIVRGWYAPNTSIELPTRDLELIR
jgi:hypothetical protein